MNTYHLLFSVVHFNEKWHLTSLDELYPIGPETIEDAGIPIEFTEQQPGQSETDWKLSRQPLPGVYLDQKHPESLHSHFLEIEGAVVASNYLHALDLLWAMMEKKFGIRKLTPYEKTRERLVMLDRLHKDLCNSKEYKTKRYVITMGGKMWNGSRYTLSYVNAKLFTYMEAEEALKTMDYTQLFGSHEYQRLPLVSTLHEFFKREKEDLKYTLALMNPSH